MPYFFKENYPYGLIIDSIREEINSLRQQILNDEEPLALTDKDLFLRHVTERILNKARPSLRKIVNATGIVLHTNLGRSPLSKQTLERVLEISNSYSTLEYNVKLGKRGSRHDHVESLICKITGAEAAMVVNNNAAATMLVLSAMAKDKEVIVSRGELVEIGGSFRIPDIMSLSGATLKEIGTTNKTHFNDYENAIDVEKTAALMKVHTSNYRIIGFTEDVSLVELRKLGDNYHLPVIYDMGNGLLADLKDHHIFEPTILEAMNANPDVMLFSGDKLLGGPQAGIIIGKKTYIDQMKRHPLARVVRIDKMTLAALEATFFNYQDIERAKNHIPTLKMLTYSKEELLKRAQTLQELLPVNGNSAIEPCEDFVGGGSAPDVKLEGYALTLHFDNLSTEKLERLFRSHDIIVHVSSDKVWLHVRTLMDEDFKQIADVLTNINETFK
ncbi:L-seryl-tRNA(Sec) selenium transferase [Lachnospiraceae bacterium TWA4]|nr:L-seryl-tRNA(Sec) selenium transferase [Lachnospiraceae bacterium TWA4]